MNKKYELDLVTEEIPFEQLLEKLLNDVTGAKIIEIELAGRGSGWPTIVIEVPNDSFDKLRMWYEGASSLEECEMHDDDWSVMER